MNSNIYQRIVVAWLMAMCVLVLTNCRRQQKKIALQEIGKKQFYYTCSMHPQVHEDHPGNCPICGMKLIKAGISTEANRIQLTAAQQELAGIRVDTIREEYTGEEKVISGTIATDENASREFSARSAGRIQRLFVRTIGEQVRMGQPLYSLYSEDLQEAEKEYLLAKEQQQKLHNPDVDYHALVGAAESKLRLWGLTPGQISALAKSGKVAATTTVMSTVSGAVGELNVHEGDYVSEGTTILKTQGLGTLWVEAQLYADEAGELRMGQKVSVSLPDLNGRTIQGKVSFINPELSDESKVDLVRVSIANPDGLLRPGMQANIFTGGGNQTVAVPASAVITSGKGSLVWVKNNDGSFSARMVNLGKGNNQYVQVTSGLSRGEVVVTTGAFLLNSEAIFRNGNEPGSMGGMKNE